MLDSPQIELQHWCREEEGLSTGITINNMGAFFIKLEIIDSKIMPVVWLQSWQCPNSTLWFRLRDLNNNNNWMVILYGIHGLRIINHNDFDFSFSFLFFLNHQQVKFLLNSSVFHFFIYVHKKTTNKQSNTFKQNLSPISESVNFHVPYSDTCVLFIEFSF